VELYNPTLQQIVSFGRWHLSQTLSLLLVLDQRSQLIIGVNLLQYLSDALWMGQPKLEKQIVRVQDVSVFLLWMRSQDSTNLLTEPDFG
jgi:hypothetical protein